MATLAAAFIVAYAATLSIALGTLAMVMIAYLTTATWFDAFRRPALSVLAALPVLAAFGVIQLICVIALLSPSVRSSSSYLNTNFIIVRTAAYWAVWLALGARLRRGGRMRATCCAGLIALAITMSFASFDWLMALTPDWSSTIFGLYWFAGGFVGALALIALLAAPGIDLGATAGRRPTGAVAKLLLTALMFWVYIGFAQYVVIWSGDIPREVTWLVPRAHGAWGGVVLTLLIVAALVFAMLLVRSVRRSAGLVGALAVLLLLAHYADTYWLVMPVLDGAPWWTIFACALMLIVVIAPTIALAKRDLARSA
jgi:hypothetical protein